MTRVVLVIVVTIVIQNCIGLSEKAVSGLDYALRRYLGEWSRVAGGGNSVTRVAV